MRFGTLHHFTVNHFKRIYYSTKTSLQKNTSTDRTIGNWMFFNAGLVGAIVIVGGLTRLTESGLSMVDWSLFHFKNPKNTDEWNEYFSKYQQSPEYIISNHSMTLDEFKKIYYMEYSHRMLGRFLGVVYFIPMCYFLVTRRQSISMSQKLGMVGIGTLIFGQGVLGWYMVKSGLDPSIIEENKTPRVSHYRLASHLTLAFAIYILMLRQGLKFSFPVVSLSPMSESNIKTLYKGVMSSNHMVILTAISGAFVAGLDAGLVYNTFPKMGDSWIPSDILTIKPFWKDIMENPTTVQFIHRILAISTTISIAIFWIKTRKIQNLERKIRITCNCLLGLVIYQVSLGITTLLYLVPIPLAAAHQAGSLFLITTNTILLYLIKQYK